MGYDESFIISDNSGHQLNKLDQVLTGVVATLEKGRDDIFDIAQESQEQCAKMELKLEELKREAQEVIKQVGELEKQEYHARIKLMEVSRNFVSYSEKDIKDAYEYARLKQMELFKLRQSEQYLRKWRDELGIQLRKYQVIASKADNFLNTTGIALKILMGNVEKISGTLEEAYRNKQLELWIVESQESERRRIARELHDGPAQSLASMLIRLDLVTHLGTDLAEISKEIKNIKKMGQDSLGDIRRIMFDLKPSLIHDEDFRVTLNDYFSDYEAKYNFNIDLVMFGQRRKYDVAIELALFRLIQEAITNVRKHAGVNRVIVKLEDNKDSVTVVIKDEGKGFNVRQISNNESYGIIGMKERVKIFGGKLDIISSPGSGTQVIITVPLEGEANNGQGTSCNS